MLDADKQNKIPAVRALFDKAIIKKTNAEEIAKLELAREFFTNPEFRKKLEDFTWKNRK